jgi:hypothetical protein
MRTSRIDHIALILGGTMTRTARPVVGSIVAAIALMVVIVACGSTATPAPVVPGGVATPPGATPAGGSTDPLGGLLGSLGLGNFLHGAPELEAALPAQMCGAASIKFSMGGASFGAAAGQIPAFYGDLVGLTGKSLADMSFASASSSGSGNCPDITAFRVNGLDQNALQTLYTQMQTSDGITTTPANIAGKNVLKTSDGDYAYFKGDTVFTVDASTDEEAALGLQLLP